MRRFLLCCLTAFVISGVYAQSDTLNRKRLALTVTTETVGYGSSLLLLNNLWYRYYPRTGFHFFNDNPEWLQLDKAGHAMTSYYLGSAGYEALRWCGVSKKKALWYGGTLGSFYLLSMEMIDGFSTDWGFSFGDVAANTFGTALFMVQEQVWDEQKIQLKFSSHLTPYASYRPSLLGYNTRERLIKDYNGQTYWLSFNLRSFLPESRIPAWLNLALGYGGEDMISGRPEDNLIYPGSFDRYRQFYLSPDIDFTRIPAKSKWLKPVLHVLNVVKVPLPTIEFSKHGTKAYFFYF